MTAKEYLQQAYHLDQKIVSKQRQIEALREIATNCSPNMTGMPRNPSPSRSPMADAISKLVDIESELKTGAGAPSSAEGRGTDRYPSCGD